MESNRPSSYEKGLSQGLACLFLAGSACLLPVAYGQANTVLLPSSMAKDAVQHCSREAPKVTKGWTPSQQDLDSLEAHLPELRNLKSDGKGLGANGDSIPDPERYYRQYVGVVVHGHRYIYVNAILSVHGDWQTEIQDICDGGTSTWGVLYDPATCKFSDLRTGGYA
jgi:hypothetical protein